MKVYAPLLKSLLDYASYLNMDVNSLKDLMANPNIDFSNPLEVVDARDYISILQKIIEAGDSKDCGFKIGEYFNISSLGLVLEISLSTSSIIQGIHILDNFLKNKFPIVSLSIVESTAGFFIRLESSVENRKVKQELLNMVLYIVYRELKLMLPKGLEPQIRFPFSKDENAIAFFKKNVEYSPEHLILLPQSIDSLEINVNRIKEIEYLLPKFVSMLNQESPSRKPFSKQVKDMALNMCNPEIPNLKQVQNQFPCSERTFQRRLTSEGTSFRNLINEIKAELSYYLSNEKHLKTKDIAYILGYSESSAYLHAQKAWKTE